MGATRQRRPRPRMPGAPLLAMLLLAHHTLAAASPPPPFPAAKRLSTRLRLRQPPQTPSPPTPLPPSHTVTLSPCTPLPVLSNCSAVPEALHKNLEGCAHISFCTFGQEATTTHLSFVLMGEEEEGRGEVVPEVTRQNDAGVVGDEAAAAGEDERIEGELSDGGERAFETGSLSGTGLDKDEQTAVVHISSKDPTMKSTSTTLTMVLLVGSVFYFPTQAAMNDFMLVRRRGGEEGRGGSVEPRQRCLTLFCFWKATTIV